MTGQRMMYYVPWILTDSALIASGFSYNGTQKTKEGEITRWDYVYCVDVLGVETGLTPLKMMQCWNHQIQQWLKNHVQMRLIKPGQKPSPSVTYTVVAVSALWHGFYPSYYLMFFNAGCLAEVAKDIYRSRVLFDFIPSQMVGFVAHVSSMIVMNYLGVAFCLLSWDKLKFFFKGTYAYIFISLPVILVLSRALGMAKIAKKKEEKLKAKLEAKQK